MKIDFSKIVLIRGEPVSIERDKEDKPVQATLGSAIRIALNAVKPDAHVELEAMIRRGRLSLRIAEGGILDVTAQEVTQMQSALSAFIIPELIVVLHDMLEQKDAASDV